MGDPTPVILCISNIEEDMIWLIVQQQDLRIFLAKRIVNKKKNRKYSVKSSYILIYCIYLPKFVYHSVANPIIERREKSTPNINELDILILKS